MNIEMRVATSSSGVPVAVGGTAAAVQVGVNSGNQVEMETAASPVISVSAGGSSAIQAGIGAAYYAAEGEYYDGAYNVTPTDHEQILQTANKIMARNVVVAPIPSNYGKITYNGSTITVS